MLSTTEAINKLFTAYLLALDIQMPLHMSFERYLFNAIKEGVTPEMITDVIRERKKRIRDGGRNPESLKLRNLIGDEDSIGDLINEAAMLTALKRKHTMNPARASILRQSGRSDAVPGAEAKPVEQIIQKLKSL